MGNAKHGGRGVRAQRAGGAGRAVAGVRAGGDATVIVGATHRVALTS